jgi:hypothetical protein
MSSKKDQRLRFKVILLLSLGSGLLACIVCVLLLMVLSSNYENPIAPLQRVFGAHIALILIVVFVGGFVGVFQWLLLTYLQDRRH